MAAEVRLPAFIRLDAGIGWEQALEPSSGVVVSPRTGSIELGFTGTRQSPLIAPSGSFGGLTLPTGVAIGPAGEVVVADPVGRVLLRNPHPGLAPGPEADTASGFAPIWPGPALPDFGEAGNLEAPDCTIEHTPQPAGVYELVKPVGVAFSADGDLLVVDVGDDVTPARLLVYLWPSMVVRQRIELGRRPHDIAVDSAGRIYIADADPAGPQVRRFDRTLREVQWRGGEGSLHAPRHLLTDSADTVYVVDADPVDLHGRLWRVDHLGAAVLIDENEYADVWKGDYPPPIQEVDGRLFAPGSTCVEHGPELRNVVVDRQGRLPQGPTLVYRPPAGRRQRTGVFVTNALDSGVFNFAWHRLVFEYDLGSAGAIAVRTFTAAQLLEPARIAALADDRWSRRTLLTAVNRPEVLIQSGPGRHLWLRIELIGDGVDTPLVDSVEILGPRNSSLQFLPAPFHEDPVSRDFIDRFLSYFDTVFAEIRTDFDRFAARLTPQGATEGAYLAWLISWFDIEILAEWSDSTRRSFLANAMRLHRARGTVAGLKMALRLHLGVEPPLPVVIEGFRLNNLTERGLRMDDLPDATLRIGGVPLAAADGSDRAHQFHVVVPDAVASGNVAHQNLRRLVDSFRPAHTTWSLITIKPGIRVGCQSTIGVDTLVGDYASAPLGEMTLGQSAQLVTEHRNVTRIGAASIGSSVL